MQALLLKFLAISVALAAEIAPFSTSTPEVSIHFWATTYSVSYEELYNTVGCESGWTFDPNIQSFAKDKRGPHGRENSWGICQYNLDADKIMHPGMTRADAKDPDKCLQQMAQDFSNGLAARWTCHRHLRAPLTAPFIPAPIQDGTFDIAPRTDILS